MDTIRRWLSSGRSCLSLTLRSYITDGDTSVLCTSLDVEKRADCRTSRERNATGIYDTVHRVARGAIAHMGGSVGTGTDGRVVRSRCAPFFAGSFLEVSDLGGDAPSTWTLALSRESMFLVYANSRTFPEITHRF